LLTDRQSPGETLPVALRDRDISLVGLQFKRLLKTLWFVYFFAPCTNILTYLLTSLADVTTTNCLLPPPV